MDAFDGVRCSAASLHDELVAENKGPLDPPALVAAALEKLELELYLLNAGDPALKGARALFDSQSGIICCEKLDDPGELALLIAHEIGHVRVHSASSNCDNSDIDASRSAEAAPIGLQRVEDYGVRERRELQANVFAREFVLPRPLAWRLHIEGGLGASEIAVHLGLPKNLVRQQLFDALLLPTVASEIEVEKSSGRLPQQDPSQERAAEHRGSAFQLQAGPGTGKTRTLVKAVLSLLNDQIDPPSILILTYSNRAAGELAERIEREAKDASTRIWIGTFHAFGLDLLRRYYEKVGLSSKPNLFDKSDAIEVLQELLPTLPLVHYRNLWDPAMILKEIVSAISRAKDEMTNPERYRTLAQAMLDSAQTEDEQKAAEKCLEVAYVYGFYEEALRQHKAMDFGDLIMRPALLLESDPSVQAEVRLRHRHVLVDEYQDVNHASTRLLKALTGDGKRLWVVGDARQSIYRFRGASSANMVAFSQTYPNAKADQLSVSYRSSAEIVDLVVDIAPNMGASRGMLPLALTSDHGPGPGRPQIRRYQTPDDEIEGIAATVRELEAGGVRLRDQAVLCRTNTRLSEIAEGLELRGIPVLHLGSLFERDEVRDMLALMSLAVDRLGNGLVRIASMPRYSIPIQDLYAATRWIAASERSALAVLRDLSKIPDLSPEGVVGFDRLAKDFKDINPGTSPWELLSTYLLDRTDIGRRMAVVDSVQGRMKAVAMWQFLNFIREQIPTGASLPIRRVLDRVRQLVLLSEERDLRQVPAAALHMDAVRLMTVHGSKGLEFEAVHLPGLTVSSFPSNFRSHRCPPPHGMIDAGLLSVAEEARLGHDQEEECLFFVAVSRARSHLVMHLPQKMANGNNRKPSPYLSWFGSGLSVEVRNPATIALPSGAPRPVPLVVERPDGWKVTDSQLRAYEKCPLRYFYTHVLGLGGAREATAFSQTHDCLYELIGWLADARRDGDPTVAEAEVAFESIWQVRGPVEHGFAADYRRLASRLVEALVKAGAGRKFRDAEPIAIDFPNAQVVVEPNEIAVMPDGAVVLRRVNTGNKRSDEFERLEYSLYHLAGQARFGKGYRVEALHLSNGTVEVVPLTSRKIQSKKDKSEVMISRIGDGWYIAETDTVVCPRCPHFFVCAAVPKGPLKLA